MHAQVSSSIHAIVFRFGSHEIIITLPGIVVIGRWMLIVLLSAGPSAAAQLELDEYLQRGDAARTRGDWESVASQFAQILNHPDLPKDGATWSAMHLEYGRALGVICQYAEAEKYLLRAKAIADLAGSPAFAPSYELGAISLAQKRFPEAIAFLSPLLPVIARDPRVAPARVVIDVYEKLAAALAATGKAEEAESRRREADKLRESRPKVLPPGTITPYGAQCPKS